MHSPQTIFLRGLIATLLAAWMIGGPFYRQALGGKSKIPRSWVMFTGYAVGEVCDVRYTLRQDGEESPIDRFSVLGYSSPHSAPKSIRVIDKKKSAVSIGRRICGRIDVEDADVRLYARCATRRGWRVVSEGQEDLCAR